MFYPGQKVKLQDRYARAEQRGAVYTVRKMLQVNLEVENDSGQRLRGKPYMFETVEGGALPSENTLYADIVRTVEARPHFELGEVVRVKESPGTHKWHYSTDQKFVVIAVKERINIVKLGGEGGQYWRMNPNSLEKVEV